MSTTPPRIAQPNLGDTPTHNRIGSFHPFTSTAELFDPVFVAAAKEMSAKYFGPISTNEFLDYYLPENPLMASMPQFSPGPFQTVAAHAIETEMYGDMISALQPFCGDIILLDTHAHANSDSKVFLEHSIKPDVSFYDKSDMPSPEANPTNAKQMLGFMEFKNHLQEEPFSDTGMFERDAVRARDTRGQIAVYNTTIAASQFRTRVFSVFINMSTCRLMCATRSGTSLTKSFDYTKEPWLAIFFWRLSLSGTEARGIDSTFQRVKEETTVSGEARQALGLSSTAPLYKVSVVDDQSKETSFYLVSDPFTDSHRYPTGRSSRCFYAYNLQSKIKVTTASRKVLLLKDNWRVDGYTAEGEIYRELNQQDVPHIPKLVTAGGVSHCTCGNEPFLERKTRRIHHHYRLVLDTVGRPLTHFDSTWQLVNVILDAMDAHYKAVDRCSLLHRDISSGNIVITDQGRGMLIDWELSKKVPGLDARTYERTGTHQFRSVRLLQATPKSNVPHSQGDDIESFLWVLIWVVARNAPHDMTDEHCAGILQSFDQQIDAGSAKKRLLRGGKSEIQEMNLTTEQLTNLLTHLVRHFSGRYESEIFDMIREQSPERAEKWLQELETHDWMTSVLRKALEDDNWKALKDASIPRQVIRTNKTLMEGRKRKSAISEYCHAPLPKKLRLDGGDGASPA
ncbi:hypothetical protein D9757_010299 [Collybiopsis confluens]|uniref:Protein kinase domain-containing protein n=1 Tax=Collybiopsis confluens TaxID=2823264 RepID=A0A8H5LVK5_9AGAR|nr:hypothetical protein D9757_010299 [Collybiopsis confluens]